MSTISLFKDIENKHDVYRCEDCMEKFCGTLREHAVKIISFRTETMKILTTEQQESYKNVKICYIFIQKSEDKYAKVNKYCKVNDHYYYTSEYRGAAYIICNLEYSVPKEFTTTFHNGSNYNHHSIIKELAKRFRGDEWRMSHSYVR